MFILDLIGNLFLSFVTLLIPTRRRQGSLTEMERLHPRSTVRRAELLVGPWLTDSAMADVVFVILNKRGLSFRDSYGHEELLVTHDQIGSLSLLPADGHVGQQVRVTSPTGETMVEFWSPDDAGDVHADFEAGLRR